MAGMEGLGRIFVPIPIASGNAVSMRHCSALTVVGTSAAAAATFTVTAANSFGGSYASPGNIITKYYLSTAQNGTAGYTKQTQTASNAVADTTLNATMLFTIFGSQLPDPKCYVKVTATGAGALCSVILHDLTYARGPVNIIAPGS